jgi:hypothetical protein
VQGELAYVQGELFVVFELWFGGFHSLAELCLCLGCVEPLPLPKGTETCLLKVILLFAFSLAFDRLLEFLLVVSFLFLFSLVTQNVCVVNALTKGEIEILCGSRIGEDHVWLEDRWMVASLCDE